MGEAEVHTGARQPAAAGEQPFPSRGASKGAGLVHPSPAEMLRRPVCGHPPPRPQPAPDLLGEQPSGPSPARGATGPLVQIAGQHGAGQ